MEDYNEKNNYEEIRRQTDILFESLSELRPSPLETLLAEAREMVRTYDPGAIKSRLLQLKAYTDPTHLNTIISGCRKNIETEVNSTSDDLEARLVKQAQSLDSLYDFFVQLSQYSMLEDSRSLQGHINLALRAQDQSARTIEKFSRLKKNSRQIAERTEQTPKQTEQNAPLD